MSQAPRKWNVSIIAQCAAAGSVFVVTVGFVVVNAYLWSHGISHSGSPFSTQYISAGLLFMSMTASAFLVAHIAHMLSDEYSEKRLWVAAIGWAVVYVCISMLAEAKFSALSSIIPVAVYIAVCRIGYMLFPHSSRLLPREKRLARAYGILALLVGPCWLIVKATPDLGKHIVLTEAVLAVAFYSLACKSPSDEDMDRLFEEGGLERNIMFVVGILACPALILGAAAYFGLYAYGAITPILGGGRPMRIALLRHGEYLGNHSIIGSIGHAEQLTSDGPEPPHPVTPGIGEPGYPLSGDAMRQIAEVEIQIGDLIGAVTRHETEAFIVHETPDIVYLEFKADQIGVVAIPRQAMPQYRVIKDRLR